MHNSCVYDVFDTSCIALHYVSTVYFPTKMKMWGSSFGGGGLPCYHKLIMSLYNFIIIAGGPGRPVLDLDQKIDEIAPAPPPTHSASIMWRRYRHIVSFLFRLQLQAAITRRARRLRRASGHRKLRVRSFQRCPNERLSRLAPRVMVP